MFTAQQYREKATEYDGLLGSAHSSGEASEFRELMQSYLAPAKNMDSLTVNHDKTTRLRRTNRDNHVAPADEENFLRYLGAAVTIRWNTIPKKNSNGNSLNTRVPLTSRGKCPASRPGFTQHENCADRAAYGERAAAALWRDRANCFLSHG